MFRKLSKLLKPEKKYFIGAIIAAFFNSMFLLLLPLVIRFIIDCVLSGGDASGDRLFGFISGVLGEVDYLRENMWICAVSVIVLAICQAICTFFRGRLTAVGAENIAKRQKDDLYDHIQNLPYNYHVKAQTGDLVQRCTSDVDTIRRFISTQFMEIFRIIFTASLAFTILLNFNVKLAFIAICIVPIISFSAYFYVGKMNANFREVEVKEGELSTLMQENFTGVRVVRAFGREVFEFEKFKKANEEYKNLLYIGLNYMAVFWGVSDCLCFMQVAAVLIAGSYMAYMGDISVGTLFVFILYMGNLVWPLRQLGRILSNSSRAGVSLGRINEILYTPLEENSPDAIKPDLKGDIVFENLSFSYESNKPVLKDISFTIKNGQKIAILGSTGSGKSSLIHLLLRLYDYKQGSIKINGNEIKDIDKRYLRERIGIVLQEPFLYSKTIIENIKMAKDNVIDDEVYEASKTANVHDVIESFKDGYETIVGERGVTLSGGQKQRVAIARTLVKDSDIFIFDDSLSAVDTETDALIQAELKEKSKGVTTFIISQRITTLMNADKIFVMENGKITDSGTHEELIGRDGLYYRVWNIQNALEDEFEKEA